MYGLWNLENPTDVLICFPDIYYFFLKNNFGLEFLQGMFLCRTKLRRALFTFAKSYRPIRSVIEDWDSGFYTTDSRIQVKDSGLLVGGNWIPDYNRLLDFRFTEIDSGFQSPGVQIPQEEIFTFRIPWQNLYPESSENLEVLLVTKASDFAIFCPQSFLHKSLNNQEKV